MESEQQLMSGNEAMAEAAIRAGCRCYFGYPITPQNEVTAYMARRMPEAGGVFIQSESELAAINMVLGAAAAGCRSMTSSSSPGISLKQEGISYIAALELPAVIANIMRGGPGLGNIAPSQADYFQAVKGGGHGDYRQIVLGPATVQELVDLTVRAFDLADAYRIPVMILADGLLGQMMEPVRLPGMREAGLKDEGWVLSGCRGRGPRFLRSLILDPDELAAHNLHLQEKYREIEARETRHESVAADDADLVLVSYGTPARVCRAAVSEGRAKGRRVGLIRPVSLWPFPKGEIERLAAQGRGFLVVEMSHGQMVEDVKLAVGGKAPVHFLGKAGGQTFNVEEIARAIEEILESVKHN